MSLLDYFKFQRAPTFSDTDDGETSELSKNISLKYGALHKVSNYVGRGVSKAKFVLKGPDAQRLSYWLYKLNVEPNPNQTASQFLGEIGKAMIEDGEVMIVAYKGNLYVADSYSKEEESLEGNKYHVTSIQGMTFDEVFKSDDVILLKNENDSLNNYLEKLWADYGELLGRVINRQKTANQIRFTFTQPKNKIREMAQEAADGERKESNQQRFFNRVVKKIKTDSVVGIPLGDKGSYAEFSSKGTGTGRVTFIDDIDGLLTQYVDDVCQVVGLSPALLHGELADNQKNYEMAIEVVFEPILRKFIDGLQRAIFSEEEYQRGNRVKVTGLHQYNLFDVATSGDKLIAAGLAMADEIREEIGLEPLPNGLGQRLYITKNYLEMRVEGGTKEDEGNRNQGSDNDE
ncbi:phage portal protein [Streptococcus gallolyticus]|uniref:phage portal protein n=1 Tax=Streptococcus gallolyticus TaxID=315405 RepID=UPI000E408D54|nr:phage portal protein [Streptococcus gallolyticus]RGC38207.1 phage portal protein [Streptococcus gallolyticus]